MFCVIKSYFCQSYIEYCVTAPFVYDRKNTELYVFKRNVKIKTIVCLIIWAGTLVAVIHPVCFGKKTYIYEYNYK